MIIYRWFLIFYLCSLSLICKGKSEGFHYTPMLGVSAASLQPLDLEDTPNYYGPDLNFLLSYRVFNYWESGFYLSHFLGVHPKRKKPIMSLSSIGFYTGLFHSKIFHLGIYGGYSLLKGSGESELGDLTGQWSGKNFGFTIGTTHKARGGRFWRLSIANLHSILSLQGESVDQSASTRKLDKFQIRLGYTFIGE